MSTYYFNTPMPFKDMLKVLDKFKNYMSFPVTCMDEDLLRDAYYGAVIYYYEPILSQLRIEASEGREWRDWLNKYKPDLADRFIEVFPVTAKILDSIKKPDVEINIHSEMIVKPITK